MNNKERNIWINLGLSLLSIPLTSLIFLVAITLIGALDDAITKVQLAVEWWLILVAAFILSLVYFIYGPKIRRNHERGKVVDGLILYWQEQLAKENKPQVSNKEIEEIRELLLERVKVWAWFDSKLWAEYFPDEKYSKYLFGIVDNLKGLTTKGGLSGD